MALPLRYICSAFLILCLFWRWDKTYERQKDTCSLVSIFLPCFSGALLITSDYAVLEILWTYSELLEAFAMVPQ